VSTDCSPTAGTSRPASSRLRCSRTAARSRAASSRTTAPSSSSGSAVEPPRTRRSAASDRPQGRGRARAGEHAALTAPRGRARRRPRRVRRARPRRRDARARPLGRPARGQPRRRPRDGARVDARAAPRGGARAGDPRRGASLLRRRGAPDGPPRRRQVARVRGGRRRRAARPRARRPCARHLVPRLDAARDRRPRAVAPPRLHLSVRPPRPVAAPPARAGDGARARRAPADAAASDRRPPPGRPRVGRDAAPLGRLPSRRRPLPRPSDARRRVDGGRPGDDPAARCARRGRGRHERPEALRRCLHSESVRRAGLLFVLLGLAVAGAQAAAVIAQTPPAPMTTETTTTTTTAAAVPPPAATAPTTTTPATTTVQTPAVPTPTVPAAPVPAKPKPRPKPVAPKPAAPKPKPKPAPTIAEAVSVGGVPVGGLTQAIAYRAVRQAFATPLTLEVGTTRVRVAPGTLGAVAYAKSAVARALAARAGGSVPLKVVVHGADVRAYVAELAQRFRREPVSSTLVLRDLKPFITPARSGQRLDEQGTVEAIVRALRENTRDPVPVPLIEVP